MTAINFPANPSNGDTHQGFVYNSTLGVWQSAGSQTAVTSFTGLSDTPSTLGTAGQIAKVNSGGTALEFADQSGVTVYATADLLPGTANAGDLAFVSGTNRLYIWNGSGWYNIALINTTPTISGVSSSYTFATDGTPIVITITATDPEGLPITYSIASDTSGNTATVAQGTGANTNVFTITPSTNDADAGTFSLTFRASDGVNIASAISEFTLAFAVQNSKYTTALITSVGTNNQVNNTFVDSSSNSHTITAAGNATQTTFSPYRHGGYSVYFGGNDALEFSNYDNQTNDFGTGDFNVECWVNFSSVSGTSKAFLSTYAGSPGGWSLFYNVANSELTFRNGDAGIIGRSWSPSTGVWYHIAVSRSSSTLRFFVDGTQLGTDITNYTQDISDVDSGGLQIARNKLSQGGSAGSYNWFSGYISDARVIKGTALYTSNFTVPKESLTAVSGTTHLSCTLPYFKDISTNNNSYTTTTTAITVPFAPYDYETYSATNNGGSMYFDGNGDYVKVTNTTTSVSGDFTIECWLNFSSYNTSGANSRVFCMKPGGNAADNLQLIVDMGTPGIAGSISIWTNAYTAQANTPINDDLWHHIAITRESGTVKIYIDGTLEGSGSNSTTFDFSGHKIGTRDETADTASKFTGSIADFRTVVGTAVYTSNFTPPTAPLADITNTLALVRGTNAGIIDKSQSIKDYISSGSVSSTAQTKFLTSSIYFDGVNDYARWTNNEGLFDLGFNGEPFTMEWWQYLPSIVNGAAIGPQTGGGAGAWTGSNGHQLTLFFYSSAATLFYQWWNGSGRTDYEFNHGGAFSTNTWQHVATVYDGTNLSTYVDGTRVGYRTSGNTFGSVTTKYASLGSNATTNQGLSESYYSDVRITKGLARYSGTSFTPPTAALKG